jgi:hypothetical protein
MGIGNSALAFFKVRQDWSNPCLQLLGRAGIKDLGQLRAAATLTGSVQNGVTATTSSASLIVDDPAYARATVADVFEEVSPVAAATAGGSAIWVSPHEFAKLSERRARATILHELLHNILAVNDDQLFERTRGRARLRGEGSFLITDDIERDCFAGSVQ